MLEICHRYSELDIPKLLSVYAEAVENSGEGRFLAEQTLCDYLREDFFLIPGAYCALWVVDQRYVSALRVEPYRDGFLVSGLETAPRDRRKGYAEDLLTAVCRRNAPIYTHVRKNNKASLVLHRKCGFRQILDYGSLLDGTISYRYITMRYPE